MTAYTLTYANPRAVNFMTIEVMPMFYFYLFQSTNNRQWYFSLNSANHKAVAQSEGYHNKADALNTIRAIKANAGSAAILDASIQRYVA